MRNCFSRKIPTLTALPVVLLSINTFIAASQLPADSSFLSAPDPASSSGHIAVRRLHAGPGNTNPALNAITVYSWSNGNFRTDIVIPPSRESTSYATGQIAHTVGTWGGTNWEYRSGTLVFHGMPSADAKMLNEALANRTSAQYELEVILGRGLLLSNFLNLKWKGTNFTGYFASGIPIRGSLAIGEGSKQFKWSYEAVGAPSLGLYVHDVTLVPFANRGNFIPARLTTINVTPEGTNLWSDYLVVGSGPVSVTFPPFSVGQVMEVFELDNGATYAVQGGRKTFVFGDRPRPSQTKKAAVIILLILLVGFPLLIVMLRQKRCPKKAACNK